MTWLQSKVLLRIHDLHGEARKWSSTTDNLSGCADFGNLGGRAGLPQRDGVLVDRNDITATVRNRQSILSQPVRDKKALRLKSIGLKRLQKPCVRTGFDRLQIG